MDHFLEWLLQHFTDVASDPRTLSLALFALVSLLLFHSTKRTRHDLAMGLLECRRDSAEDAGIIASLLTIAAEYRVLVKTAVGGPRRKHPHELTTLEDKYRKLRDQVHEVRNNRVTRLERLLEEQRRAMKEAGSA